ncbi:MAG: PqqD family protein [Lachnospiraceae bacterium]|nr:PqqD family protein [Lachnospiraceae bacterium]
MALTKRQWTKPDLHCISHIGPLSNDDIAALSDDELEAYLTENSFLKEKKLYQANPEYIFREIAGESILVPTGKTALQFSGMGAMNRTAVFLWKLLKEEHTCADLSKKFAQEYDLTEEQSRQDVTDFLEAAQTHNAVVSVGWRLACQ